MKCSHLLSVGYDCDSYANYILDYLLNGLSQLVVSVEITLKVHSQFTSLQGVFLSSDATYSSIIMNCINLWYICTKKK